MNIELRPFAPADLPAVVELNNAAYPAVPIFDLRQMADLVSQATQAVVAVRDGTVLGFLITIGPDSAYDSENYVYFTKRAETAGTRCLYIDRIVLAEEARGAGLGRRLYETVFTLAAEKGLGEVTCEVNIEPPNPESLAFHARMGFERVGEQSTKGGAFVVALLAAPVGTTP